MNKILTILAIILICFNSAYAIECGNKEEFQKPTFKEQRRIDGFLDERLNLTIQQKEELKKARAQHRKEMEKIVKKMQELRDKIRDVYMTGIPQFQADLKTAPMKAELVLLKQNADRLRQEHRKTFESILTPEQRAEFDQIKKEYAPKHPRQPN